MARTFSLATVIRGVDPPLLRRFVAHLGHEDLGIDWPAVRKRSPEPVLRALAKLGRKKLDAVEAAFHDVFDLGCETGVAAIYEAAGPLGIEPFPPDPAREPTPYEQAILTAIHAPAVLARALTLHEVDHLTWWRRRTDLPKREPDRSPAAVARLQAALSAVLVKVQGRGRVTTVEPVDRRGVTFFHAHLDDYVLTVQAHDARRQLRPNRVNRTFDVVFAFDPAEGTLELCARLPPKVKLAFEQAFAREILATDLGPWTPPATVDLNRLKDQHGPLATDAEDDVGVEVRQIRLTFKNPKNRRRIELHADPQTPGDVFAMLREVLDRETVPLSAVDVARATFAFTFGPTDVRPRPKTVTFDVALPHHCGVRNDQPDLAEVVMKYLIRWRIYVGRKDQSDLAAAG